MARVGSAISLALLLLVVVAIGLGPAFIEGAVQGVEREREHPVTDGVRRQHEGTLVADWHADSLMWQRDLLARSDRGHVDFPRLREGNVAIQVFTAVTHAPAGERYEGNTGGFDVMTPLVVLQRWPVRTWNSRLQRALHQAEKLERFVEASEGRVVWVRHAEDLRRVLGERNARGPDERPLAALLGVEGAHCLEGELANVDALYEAGFRMVGLQHFFDNELGGSLHGVSGEGLTEFGRQVVRRLEERRMIVDLAHSSPAVVDDVLAMATRPVVVSHTGLAGICDSPRNLSDDQMKRIAEGGGLVAIGFWEAAICDDSPAGVARALRHGIDLLGRDHVALGSDFDGGTTTQFDAAELAVLTQAMVDADFSATEIAQVMGANTFRFLLQNLPAE